MNSKTIVVLSTIGLSVVRAVAENQIGDNTDQEHDEQDKHCSGMTWTSEFLDPVSQMPLRASLHGTLATPFSENEELCSNLNANVRMSLVLDRRSNVDGRWLPIVSTSKTKELEWNTFPVSDMADNSRTRCRIRLEQNGLVDNYSIEVVVDVAVEATLRDYSVGQLPTSDTAIDIAMLVSTTDGRNHAVYSPVFAGADNECGFQLYTTDNRFRFPFIETVADKYTHNESSVEENDSHLDNIVSTNSTLAVPLWQFCQTTAESLKVETENGQTIFIRPSTSPEGKPDSSNGRLSLWTSCDVRYAEESRPLKEIKPLPSHFSHIMTSLVWLWSDDKESTRVNYPLGIRRFGVFEQKDEEAFLIVPYEIVPRQVDYNRIEEIETDELRMLTLETIVYAPRQICKGNPLSVLELFSDPVSCVETGTVKVKQPLNLSGEE